MGKLLSLIIGVVGYFLAVATVVYAIGFEENILVSKSVDSGVAGPVGTAIMINVFFLALFVVQHTIMARPAFKARWTRIIPQYLERTTYGLAATLMTALILWQWQPIAGEIWNVEGTPLGQGLMVINFVGWAIFFWSTFLINHFELFGLQQVWNNFRGNPPPPMLFKTPALYKMCRHPMMFGFIVAFVATPHMTVSHLFFSAAIIVYIFIGIWFEERDLVKSLGPRYEVYQQQVPMIFPLFGKRGTPSTTSD